MMSSARIRASLGLALALALTIIGCESVGLRSMKIYMQQENWQKALDQGMTAVNENPRDADAWFNIGVVAAQLDSNDLMIRAFDRTSDLTDKYDDMIEQIRQGQYNEIFNRAVQNYNAGDLDKAREQLLMAIRIDENRPNAPKVLGMIYHRDNDIESALDMYSRAIEADTSDVDLARQYAALLHQSGKREEAISVLERTYRANPGDKDVVLSYIAMLQADGQYDRAIQVALDALAQAPDDPDYNMNAGVLYMAKAQAAEDSAAIQSSTMQAIPHFKKVLTVDSTNVDAAYDLAMTYRTIGQLNKAAEPLAAVVERTPDDYVARQQLATVLLQLEKVDEAEPHLLRVVEQIGEPTNAEQRRILAQAYRYLQIIYTVQGNNLSVQAQDLREEADDARGARKRELQNQALELEQQSQQLIDKAAEMGSMNKMYSDD